MCIDQGSERCACCHELDGSASRCQAACDRSIAHVHAEGETFPADDDRSAFSDSCGCTHYLIVQQQGQGGQGKQGCASQPAGAASSTSLPPGKTK